MLTLYHNGEQIPIDLTEYYIRELASGLDEVIFNISVWDPVFRVIQEQEQIIEKNGQTYLVKQIDAGAETAKIICQLDLDAWRADMKVNYDSGSKTVAQQIEAVKPTGWTVVDRSGSIISRTLHGDFTPLQICEQCRSTYSVYIRWDTKMKECTIISQAMGNPVGAFATRELNLKEINYKGKSTNFATRLYPYGKDDLTIRGATIEGQTYPYAYVDNHTYSDRIISVIWKDERYTDVESLYNDAVEKLAKMAAPTRSYDCAIVDLQATNPEKYNNLDFSLFTCATLIDDTKENAVNYQVVERHVWPYHPDRNDVIFNSEPLRITASVVQIADDIENQNSPFNEQLKARIANATDWLTSSDGYIFIARDSAGWWKEIYMMDTNDPSTAQDIWRLNNNGIGISHSGLNGPYVSAWTIDGKFNCDWLQTGKINANLIQAGVISDLAGKFSLNMVSGAISMKDGTFEGTVKATGGYFQSGYFGTGGLWEITANGIHTKNGPTAPYGQTTEGTYVGTDGFCCNGPSTHVWISAGALTTNGGLAAKGVTVLSGGDLIINGGVYAGSYPGATGTISWVTSAGGYALNIQKGIIVSIVQPS